MVLLLVAAMLVPRNAHARGKRSRASKAPAGNILVLGSSSINGALGKHIEKQLVKRGFKVHRQGKSSAGLARPDYFDWLAEVAKLPTNAATRGAVIYLGTNDGQAIYLRPAERKALKHRGKWLRWGHKHWESVYQERVRQFAKALCKAGVWRVAFVTPVDTTDSALLKRLQQIRRLQYRGARKSRCAWAYSGRGDYRKIRREKARTPASKRLRYKDGFHMTQLGAATAWARVEKRIVRYFSKRKPHRLRKPRAKRRKNRRKATQRLARSRAKRHKKG